MPIEFRDGSAMRLTIARYHTPSGRCIQRPYNNGKNKEYEMDIYNRYTHGEFFSKDSIKQDQSQKFTTRLGREVYGGGGIMPDIFVPQDTTGLSSYSTEVFNKVLTVQLAFQYTAHNREKLTDYTTEVT